MIAADCACGSVTILSTSFGKKNDPSEEELLAPDTDRATPLSYWVEIQRPMGQDWNKWTGRMDGVSWGLAEADLLQQHSCKQFWSEDEGAARPLLW